jgi:hypothetical protein
MRMAIFSACRASPYATSGFVLESAYLIERYRHCTLCSMFGQGRQVTSEILLAANECLRHAAGIPLLFLAILSCVLRLTTHRALDVLE